jgi:hypothetical protein
MSKRKQQPLLKLYPPSEFLLRLRLPEKPSLRKPRLHLPSIPVYPRRLGPHTVKTLRKSLIESLRTLAAEKGFDFVDRLERGKVVGDDLDDAAEHAEAGGEFFDEGGPIFFCKGPECADSFGVGAQSNPVRCQPKKQEGSGTLA